MITTTVWPASWNARSVSSTTRWPTWMSGAVGSSPSLTRRRSPRRRRSQRWSATWISTARPRSHCQSGADMGPKLTSNARLRPERGAVALAERLPDDPQLAVHLGVGQRSVGQPERQRERVALAAIPDLAAPVLVERRGRLQQLAARLLDGPQQLARRHVLGDHDAEVAVHR